MDRRTFVKSACASCLPVLPLLWGVGGCASVPYVDGTLDGSGLTIDKAAFTISKEGSVSYHPYVVVRNERLQFPICLYRLDENQYTALLLKCTHQGTELQVAGDHLHCPAHGSEFNNRGEVTQGPADAALRRFPVVQQDQKIFIDLKA